MAMLGGRPPQRPQPARSVPPPPPPPLPPRGHELNHGALPGFVRCDAEPVVLPRREKQSNPVLYAVIGTWHEGDVIEATVRNCFANGCSKVFIVDNDSPDDTCIKAIRAGATLALKYQTDYYDDDYRLRLMNRVMEQVTVSERLPDLWWLSLDADEFPCGPRGETVLEFLSHLDDRYNAVGTSTIDLFPTEAPHYLHNRHPADCMTMGIRRKGPFCHKQHWKHPLLRQRHGDYVIAQSRGSHTPFVRPLEVVAHPTSAFAHWPRPFVCEPVETLTFFHAPMRAKADTFKRLQIMCSKQDKLHGHTRGALDDNVTQSNGSIKRWKSLEDVYAGNWDKVELPHSQIYGQSVVGIALFPWRTLAPLVTSFPRWYDHENAAVPAKLSLPLVST